VTLLDRTCAAIVDVDHEAAAATQRLLDNKTKPRRSLGRLEDLACQIAGIHGNAKPPLPTKAVVVMAGDHGVALEGVSAYPPEVTWQMLLNFSRGGAAINVLSRQVRARLCPGIREEIGQSSDLRRDGTGLRWGNAGPHRTPP
jgi:nicotinate-nucleotide--dimethylbenzimidazole phosphoribosyltransferase